MHVTFTMLVIGTKINVPSSNITANSAFKSFLCPLRPVPLAKLEEVRTQPLKEGEAWYSLQEGEARLHLSQPLVLQLHLLLHRRQPQLLAGQQALQTGVNNCQDFSITYETPLCYITLLCCS